MQVFLTTLLECSIAMSVISLIYMAATPFLLKRYTANGLYYVWLVVVIGWIFPFRSQFNTALLSVKMPVIQSIPTEYMEVESLAIFERGVGRTTSISLWWVIGGMWVAGVLGMMAYHGWRHLKFVKMVSRWGEDVTNCEVLDTLDTLRAQMKIRAYVGIKVCPGIRSPMLIGFFRPIVLLPSIEIATDELVSILRHELVHLKRNDLWYKALILLATAIHWFNPVVYIMAKVIMVQCEISCDELLLQGASLGQRKQYGETIIGVVRNGVRHQTTLSTNFYGGKRGMKTRIFSIMDTRKKKVGITIFCVAIIATIGTGVVFATNSPENAVAEKVEKLVIGPTEPKQIINVDVKSLESGEFVAVGGPYTLEEGDIIQYDITSEGKGHLNPELRKTNDPHDTNGYLGMSGVAGNFISDFDSFKVSKSLAGTYYLWIGNFDGKTLDKTYDNEALSNIKGTVNIAVEITSK